MYPCASERLRRGFVYGGNKGLGVGIIAALAA